MNDTKVAMGNFDRVAAPQGLKDGGHVILRCSACGEPLVDIWIVKADAINPVTSKPFAWKGKAKCWKCGDSSFPVTWQGRFALGHYGIDSPNTDPDLPTESRVTSKITRIETMGDMFIYHTTKGD